MMNKEKEAGSSLSRALEILALFTIDTPVLTAEDIASRLGYTRSTAYRYIKELSAAGLIAATTGAAYSLGPRIVELERMLALTDPLYRAGAAVLDGQECDNNALLLHNLYQDKVLCIYKVGPDVLQHGNQHVVILRARGIPFSLFQGAASLAMLAYLSQHRIRQTYLRNEQAIKQAGLGQNWDEFRHKMSRIRRIGYATSRGQITPMVMGVAVPILLPGDQRLIGSLASAHLSAAMPPENEAACAQGLHALAERIAQEYLSIAPRGQAPYGA
ncbi:IclR family transcriptional regulator [Parapusillimonas sp. JC17]|uniref:IclR family transcriptional regulator n=1 Tax=Parapusillimonas sp. JC17 TaxID=3445768 RepID=UPI003FA11B1F